MIDVKSNLCRLDGDDMMSEISKKMLKRRVYFR